MKVLLLSGGIESTALVFYCKPQLCITIDYGQPAFAGEERASKAICAQMSVPHKIIHAPVSRYVSGGDRSWWPYRNQLLITLGLIAIDGQDKTDLLIGLVKDDVYADCKVEFLRAMKKVISTQGSLTTLDAPAIRMSTLDLIRISGMPVEFMGVTFSCHEMEYPCGSCRGCRKSSAVKAELCDLPNVPS